MRDWLLGVWYGERPGKALLLPLSGLFRSATALRRYLYANGLLSSTRLAVPVIVVGNVSVGGTGKTPLVLWLAEQLKAQGLRPGIVSRGYGGHAREWPQTVQAGSDPGLVGDEPVLLASRSQCPVAVGPDRAAAAGLLVEEGADIVLSDDGLQHYGLARDLEIAVVDGARGFGNGACLPAGPLREPQSRLDQVGFIVINRNGEPAPDLERLQSAAAPVLAMRLHADEAITLRGDASRSLDVFRGRRVHALAGIGNPQRFFDLLTDAGLEVVPHALPDHAELSASDLAFADDLPVLMTEKDAVKCRRFAPEGSWYVPVTAALAAPDAKRMLDAIADISSRRGGRAGSSRGP